MVSTNSPMSPVNKSKKSGCSWEPAKPSCLGQPTQVPLPPLRARHQLRDRLGAGERERTWLLSISGPDCSSAMSSQWAHTIPRFPPSATESGGEA